MLEDTLRTNNVVKDSAIMVKKIGIHAIYPICLIVRYKSFSRQVSYFRRGVLRRMVCFPTHCPHLHRTNWNATSVHSPILVISATSAMTETLRITQWFAPIVMVSSFQSKMGRKTYQRKSLWSPSRWHGFSSKDISNKTYVAMQRLHVSIIVVVLHLNQW